MKSDSKKGKVVLNEEVMVDELPDIEAPQEDSEQTVESVDAKAEEPDDTAAEDAPKKKTKSKKKSEAKPKESTEEVKEASVDDTASNALGIDETEDSTSGIPKKRWRLSKKTLLITSGIVLLLLIFWVVVGLLFSIIKIGDHGLSGRSSDQLLIEAMQKQVDDYILTISYPDGKTKEYKLETLGISMNNDASVKATRREQHSIKSRASWLWAPAKAQYEFDERSDVLRDFIAKEIDVSVQPSKDATLTIEKGSIKLTDSVSGIRYSLKDPEAVIKNATHNLQKEPIKLEKLTKDPDLSEELLKPYKESLDKTLNQPIKFVIGDKTITPSTIDIAAWLDITPDTKEKKLNITVNSGKVVEYINKIAKGAIRPARSQVIVKKPDGSEQVIVEGVRGMDVLNKSDVSTSISKTLLENKGISSSLPVSYAPYKTISTGYYPKWIEADITNKRLYAHEYTDTVKTLLISAGAPATPTITGQYTIGRKVVSQDMRGRNVDGSNYFQPRVPYVNYFYQDYAIHGNYWRPTSYFGNINSSHGCIGLMTADAAWLYNWAPAGTPVIVYK